MGIWHQAQVKQMKHFSLLYFSWGSKLFQVGPVCILLCFRPQSCCLQACSHGYFPLHRRCLAMLMHAHEQMLLLPSNTVLDRANPDCRYCRGLNNYQYCSLTFLPSCTSDVPQMEIVSYLGSCCVISPWLLLQSTTEKRCLHTGEGSYSNHWLINVYMYVSICIHTHTRLFVHM